MKISRSFFMLVIITLLVGCNLPGGQSPTAAPFPIPNQTMTALFSTPLPTIVMTAKPGQATPTTNLPTATPTSGPLIITSTPTDMPPVITVTDTVQPNEPTATLTAVPVDTSKRTVTSATASYFSTKPVIDGDWNDFVNKEYPAEIVVYGGNTWKGRDDLGASFRIGWDAANLYIAVKVRDDKYVQNATGEDIFKGDSIEILLDTKVADDYFYTKLSPDDFQLGISPGRPNTGGTKEAYLWLPTNIAGSRSQVKIASLRSDAEGITRIEIEIPWSIFEVTPKAGAHFGFALSVSDNDLSTQNVQQKMVSNVKTRVLTDPTTWGDLTLGN